MQATPCVDWDLKPPSNGELNCLSSDDDGLECIATCKDGFRFTDGQPTKSFTCEQRSLWSPSSVVPDCVSENTHQADYHVIPSVTYRANGAVPSLCLRQYADILSQHYDVLNEILTERCSAVKVNMNVSFIDTRPQLLDENLVQVRRRCVLIIVKPARPNPIVSKPL